MAKRVVATNRAPEAMGPYSQAIHSEDLLFCSGQLGVDPTTQEVVGDSMADQTRRTLENLKAVLEAAGGSLDSVIKVNAYLLDMSEFAEFNEVYAGYFGSEPPARAAVGVAALPKPGARIELECVARVQGDGI